MISLCVYLLMFTYGRVVVICTYYMRKRSSIIFGIFARVATESMLGAGVNPIVHFKNVGLGYCTCT